MTLQVINITNITLKVKRITTNSTNSCFILATFQMRFFSPFLSFHNEKYYKLEYYNKQITTLDNGNVQSYDKKESKLNSTITTESGAHTLTHDQII